MLIIFLTVTHAGSEEGSRKVDNVDSFINLWDYITFLCHIVVIRRLRKLCSI